ncbi:DUF4350 domain-containing protein [Halomicrobium katesii]|uniref:DUF4350 domain-containing protein n=1 Tax=Halomicrobium katesii TaxID=437163 RepID=UPI00037B317D|nr:DUF4350 domain-containing protein [Halomicrobium katesii]
MELRDAALKAGVFVAVFLVVATLTGLGSIPVPVDGNETAPLTVQSHQPEAILADSSAEAGEIEPDATASEKTVVIDQSHNNSVAPGDISPLVTSLTAAGHDVQFYTDAMADRQSLGETLSDADAFVVVAPNDQYNESERRRVEQFADDGGRVLLVNEPPRQAARGATASTPMTNLAGAFGLGFDGGYLYDLREYDTNHRAVYATPTSETALTEGVDRVTAYTARPVVGGSSLLDTNESTALSTTRRQARYSVLARQGNAVALGDRSLLGPDYAYTADNEVLIGNLIEFLVSGSR